MIEFVRSTDFVGELGLLPEELIVDLAFAAPVFAESIIFLKKPDFFAFGVVKPPKMPALSFIHSGACAVLGVSGW